MNGFKSMKLGRSSENHFKTFCHVHTLSCPHTVMCTLSGDPATSDLQPATTPRGRKKSTSEAAAAVTAPESAEKAENGSGSTAAPKRGAAAVAVEAETKGDSGSPASAGKRTRSAAKKAS